MSYSMTNMSNIGREEKFLIAKNREIINVLMDSPFYFFLPVAERKEIVERITHMLQTSHNEIK